MTEIAPEAPYIYKSFGFQDRDRRKAGRIYAIGGLPEPAVVKGLTKEEARKILLALTNDILRSEQMGLKYNTKPGDLYAKGRSVYRVVGYQASPTVILERLVGPDEEHTGDGYENHAVGCLNSESFQLLKTET
jgi:hypothetical protein